MICAFCNGPIFENNMGHLVAGQYSHSFHDPCIREIIRRAGEWKESEGVRWWKPYEWVSCPVPGCQRQFHAVKYLFEKGVNRLVPNTSPLIL